MIGHRDAGVVNEIFSDGQICLDLYAERFELQPRANTREKQQLWGINSPGTDDYFFTSEYYKLLVQ